MAGSFLARCFPRVNAQVNTLYRALRLYSSNRSLRAWGKALSYAARSAFAGPVPPFITIALTYRCPCRCVHCGAGAPKGDAADDLDTDEFKRVMDQAAKMGALQVTFTGGEPLLRDDLDELVRHGHGLGLLTRVNTSGLLLTQERAGRLRDAGLTQCAVSIDDATADVHDRLRGVPGAHKCALAGIENLRHAGILCQINIYAARRNVTQGLENVIALGRRLGVLAVYIILPTATGRWENSFDQALTEEEKRRVRSLQETTFVHLELATRHTPCGVCQKGVLFVSPRGDVTPCPFVPYVFGNVREHRLVDIWRLHCDRLDLESVGECVMNVRDSREALRRHVESVALELE
jgi:MoaA/NifB/PqqE/SkfB family radical SAM enzyme